MKKIIALFVLLLTVLLPVVSQEITITDTRVRNDGDKVAITYLLKHGPKVNLQEYEPLLFISWDKGTSWAHPSTGVESASPDLSVKNEIYWIPRETQELYPFLDPANTRFRIVILPKAASRYGLSTIQKPLAALAQGANQKVQKTGLTEKGVAALNEKPFRSQGFPVIETDPASGDGMKGIIDFIYQVGTKDKKLLEGYRPLLLVSFDEGRLFYWIDPKALTSDPKEPWVGKNLLSWNPKENRELFPHYVNRPFIYRLGIYSDPDGLFAKDIIPKDKLTALSRLQQDLINAEAAAARERSRRERLRREAEAREAERQAAIRSYDWEEDARSRYTPLAGRPPVRSWPADPQPPAPLLTHYLSTAVSEDANFAIEVHEVRRFRRADDDVQIVQMIVSMENRGDRERQIIFHSYDAVSISYAYQMPGGGTNFLRAGGRLEWIDPELSRRIVDFRPNTKLWAYVHFQDLREGVTGLETLSFRYTDSLTTPRAETTQTLTQLPIHPDRWHISPSAEEQARGRADQAPPPAPAPVPPLLISPPWDSFPDWKRALEFHRTAERGSRREPIEPQPLGPEPHEELRMLGYRENNGLNIRLYEAMRYRNPSGLPVIALLISVQNTGSDTRDFTIAQGGISTSYVYSNDKNGTTGGGSEQSRSHKRVQAIHWIDRNLNDHSCRIPAGQEVWGLVYYTGRDLEQVISLTEFLVNEGNATWAINVIPEVDERWRLE